MNTQDIELPPLPLPRPSARGYDSKHLEKYGMECIEADRKRRGEPVAWLYEDELPDNYPYDEMFGFSEVRDGVRMFPVFWPGFVITPDYLDGHRHGLEWAAQVAEANHPLTGDWLYDDPHELAKALRKGPEMPPVTPQPADPRLDAPAQVGPGRFGIGVKWSTVIRAAQRHHEYMRQPEQEQARMKKFGEAIKSIQPAEPVTHNDCDLSGQFERSDIENHRLRRAIQKIMARLTELLDEDQFATIEGIATDAGVEPPAEPVKVPSDDTIREVFLANGFTIKDGADDLAPYVYAAGRSLIERCRQLFADANPDAARWLKAGAITYAGGRWRVIDS